MAKDAALMASDCGLETQTCHLFPGGGALFPSSSSSTYWVFPEFSLDCSGKRGEEAGGVI